MPLLSSLCECITWFHITSLLCRSPRGSSRSRCQASHLYRAKNLLTSHLCAHRISLRYTILFPAFLALSPAYLLPHHGWRTKDGKLQSALLALGFDTWCSCWYEVIADQPSGRAARARRLLPDSCSSVKRKEPEAELGGMNAEIGWHVPSLIFSPSVPDAIPHEALFGTQSCWEIFGGEQSELDDKRYKIIM